MIEEDLSSVTDTDKNQAIKSFLNMASVKSAKGKKNEKNSRKNTFSINKTCKVIPLSPLSEKELNDIQKRLDRFGSPIKKGGQQRLLFRDKIKDNENKSQSLCDVVNIPMIRKSIDKISIKKSSSHSSKTDSINKNKIANQNVIANNTNPSTKNSKNENCSCLCIIF